jgi:hypothetical protein
MVVEREEEVEAPVKSKGKADLTVVFTDTLTDKHSFDAPLDGTRVFR